jgi:RHS repeat-associated protein
MPVTQPRFYDTGLANGVTYSYRVKSIDTALRQSVPSTLASAMPKDANPPGRLTDVKATPEREAGQIKVSWRRGYEADVAYYQVFRSTDPDDLGQELTGGDSHILPVVNQDRYSVIDENATQGHTYYYSVNVVDGASNVSTASEHVSARPRHSALTRPHLTKTIEYQLIEGTTSTDGTPQGNKNGSDVSAEDDDVAQAALDWLPGPTGTSRFSIYRKASDEDDYVLVGTLDPPFPSLPRYSDSTLTKGDYTYYVTRSALVGTDTEESPGSDPPNPNWARVVHPYPTNASVRNLMMTDSRREYTTYNRESRGIRVDWSRVPEPELRGYNVYRMCALGLCSEGESMDTFACEPDWVRVNESIVPPDTRHFADSSVGGLKGCFMYAIRPVGPFFVEGPITKVVESSVRGGQDMSANKEYDTDATAAYFYDNPTQDYVYIDTALDAIKDVPRGTGGSDGPPSPPTSASRVVFRKLGSFAPEGSSGRLQEPARIAQVNWVMPSPNTLPSDLRGFHIEMAGSPDGPWKRVTNRPVAWWERRYSVQGVDLEWGFRLTSHMEACASFRVISVDEDGNESAPRAAGNNPDSTLCPMTPAAPTNLRATSVGVGTLEEDNIRLDWDASPGATKYFVYRLMLLNDRPFFYPTSETTVNYYDERGNDYDRTVDTLETVCPYEPRVNACRIAELEAYYVTARKVIPGSLNPGESPRSNLVFITWGAEPVYAKSTKSAEPPVDAIAAAPEAEPELLACWQSGPEGMMLPGDQSAVSAMEAEFAAMSPHDSFRTDLTTAPMRTLGTLNPPWALLNLHTDHLGSVRLVTDANGTVLSEHKYFPFGEPMLGEAYFYNTHKFTGHERDAESGMDYMLARYYSSSQSRFLSTDPVAIKPERLRIPQRLNLYTYAANNPIKFFDPTGEDVEVGNRAVKGTLGIGAHAFIIVKPTGANVEKFKDRTDPKTGTITLSGHPKDGNLVRTQNDARDVGKATQTINVAAPKGTSMEKFEANVIQASDSYKNDAKYEATPGPGTYNSNSLASGTLKAAGSDHTPTTSDLDGYNAGWDQAVPLPDATADDSPKPEEQPKKEEKKQP